VDYEKKTKYGINLLFLHCHNIKKYSMGKNINKSAFNDATELKLDIFGECFEEWLPVFNNDIYTKEVYIFDFFAGSGTDANNNLGSPLILLDKAKGKDRKYCLKAQKKFSLSSTKIK